MSCYDCALPADKCPDCPYRPRLLGKAVLQQEGLRFVKPLKFEPLLIASTPQAPGLFSIMEKYIAEHDKKVRELLKLPSWVFCEKDKKLPAGCVLCLSKLQNRLLLVCGKPVVISSGSPAEQPAMDDSVMYVMKEDSICPDCEGRGEIMVEKYRPEPELEPVECERCEGTGSYKQ